MQRRIFFNTRTVPFALLILCVLAFGLLVPWLGFYQDDWVVAWFREAFGPRVFLPFFAGERPFLAVIYIITTSIVGSSSLAWHIFGLISYWICALAVWWTLRMLWPRHTREATWIAFLFLVYPSFREQSVPVVHSQNYILLAMEIFSLGLMIWSIRRPHLWLPLTVAGMLLSGFCLFSAEYFVGLELLRPVLAWMVVRETTSEWKQRLQKTFLFWLPYLVVFALFLYWRIFIFKFVTYQPKLVEGLLNNPRLAVTQFIQTVIQDAFDVTVFAWTQTLDFIRTISPGLLTVIVEWVTVLLGSAIAAFYFLRFKPPITDIDEPEIWGIEAILLGLLSLFVVGWPYWFTGLPVELDISNDRFTLVFMFGASILTIGLIEFLVRRSLHKIIILGILIGLAMGVQVRTANIFKEVHQAQDGFFRQLAWRAPGLEPSTLLLTNPLPFPYSGSNSLNAPLNWIYNSRNNSNTLDFLLYFIPERLGDELPALTGGLPIKAALRTLKFSGSTSQALVAYYEPPGCLQVMDPMDHEQLPRLPGYMSQSIPLSNMGQIIPEDDQPTQKAEKLFGPAQKANWCYYFEKADLARQLGDWIEVARLGDEGLRLTSGPAFKYETELLPFIEGYAHVGNWENAFQLTRRASGSVPALQPVLCATWERIFRTTLPSQDRDSILNKVTEQLNCDFRE